MYSERLLELFHHPTRRLEVVGAQRRSQQYNPVCGDVLELAARWEGGRVAEIGFGGRGCPPLLAAAEWLCRWSVQKSVEEVMALSGEELIQALGGIPGNKRHAIEICLEAAAEICRDVTQGV